MKILLGAILLTYASFVYSVPSFPGCQGGGCISVGGRGGAVFEVTNLNDSGAGSLRACVEAVGARTCVFKVGGTINMLSGFYLTNPYLTVAGQTAPGGGILLSGKAIAQHMVVLSAHDMIWRYMRHRKGYSSACSVAATSDCGATMISESRAYNIVIDHNSTSWNQDEGIGFWSATATSPVVKNVTVSYNLIAEGLISHSTGIITGGAATLTDQMTDIDIHHNLIINNSHRNPLLKHKSSRLVNNVYYNQNFYVNQMGGGVSVDIINNLFKLGPMNKSATHEIQAYSDGSVDLAVGNPSAYVVGNIGWHQASSSGNQWLMASQVLGENGSDTSNLPFPTAWQRATALANTLYPIVSNTTAIMEPLVVASAGASQKLNCNGTWAANRDAVDTRLNTQYNTNTGITVLPTTEDDVGGFPTIVSGTPCADTDHDGMPDVWESANHLNPNLSSDGAAIIASGQNAGYSNLEIYLAGR
jgi:pectate lyase